MCAGYRQGPAATSTNRRRDDASGWRASLAAATAWVEP